MPRDWSLRDWREPPRYYIMRGGRIIRRPHEDFKPIDPSSPLATFDYAKLEGNILNKLMKERK